MRSMVCTGESCTVVSRARTLYNCHCWYVPLPTIRQAPGARQESMYDVVLESFDVYLFYRCQGEVSKKNIANTLEAR